MLNKIFADNIKKYRFKHNLSQEKFAELVDIGKNTVSQIEIGGHSPTLSLIEKISVGMKTPTHLLMMQDYLP